MFLRCYVDILGIKNGINFGRRKFIPMEDIASRLKQVRGKRSAKDFASLIGCNMQTIYRYEWGERVPDEHFLQKVAEKTGTSLDWLKGDDLGRITPPENSSGKKKSLSAKQYYAELEARLEKAELKIESLEVERKELAADNRRLYREKEQLLREKEELLRENGSLREKLARLEAGHGKRRSAHEDGEGDFPSLFNERRTIPLSSRTGESVHK